MKKTIIIFLTLLLFIYLAGCPQRKNISKSDLANKEDSFEIPRMAFKLLIDSTIDPCPICAKKVKDKAFSILNRYFKPGTLIKGNKICSFIRTNECDPNEFVLSCYKTRETYIHPKDKREKYFPLLVFKFHTVKNHLIGISKDKFTDKELARKINKSKLGSLFKGEIEIIKFSYGDGLSFNYFKKKNRVQVHCKILSLEDK